MWAMPYSVIVILVIINIIGIFLDSSIKSQDDINHKDIVRRYRISILPRLYFLAISIWFAFDSTVAADDRTIFGRYGLFSILAIDSYYHFANFIDANSTKINIILESLKIKIIKKLKEMGKRNVKY